MHTMHPLSTAPVPRPASRAGLSSSPSVASRHPLLPTPVSRLSRSAGTPAGLIASTDAIARTDRPRAAVRSLDLPVVRRTLPVSAQAWRRGASVSFAAPQMRQRLMRLGCRPRCSGVGSPRCSGPARWRRRRRGGLIRKPGRPHGRSDAECQARTKGRMAAVRRHGLLSAPGPGSRASRSMTAAAIPARVLRQYQAARQRLVSRRRRAVTPAINWALPPGRRLA